MSLLLLDPLVLLVYLGVAVYGWWVWSGRFRSWFGPQRLWLGLWPLPAVVAGAPLLTGPLLRTADMLGPAGDGLVSGILFLLANVALIVGLWLAPPRLLLPPWARDRLTTPATDPGAPAPGPADRAVPAAQASHVQARTSWPRWRWRIDALAGHAWVDDGELHFVATDAPHAGIGELDQDEVDQLELQLGADARLRPPRGGWWTRRRLDVRLDELDAWRVTATRPWDRAGLLVLEVDGRPPLRLWSPRVERLRRDIAGALRPSAD